MTATSRAAATRGRTKKVDYRGLHVGATVKGDDTHNVGLHNDKSARVLVSSTGDSEQLGYYVDIRTHYSTILSTPNRQLLPAVRLSLGTPSNPLISVTMNGNSNNSKSRWRQNDRHQRGDAENARHENARNAIVWNTECCICLFIAEQECMSRQERAPDFAANCGCPICRSEITMVLRLY